MNAEIRIITLGTGGGRFVTMTQRRRTAGIRILHQDLNLHLDPGPGALVHSINEGFDPRRLTAVFVSHCHPDHYTDAEVLIEAMTQGMTKKRGTLVADRAVLRGNSACEASISKYHQGMTQQIIEAVCNQNFPMNGFEVSVSEARHTDPDAVGFRFRTKEFGDFAYTSDTEYYEGISKYYENLRLLILCVMRPSGKPWKGHMTTDDAIRILSEAHPERAVLTHLGMQMLLRGPSKEAESIERATGVPTVAAADGMQITLGESIEIGKVGKKNEQSLSEFF